MDYCVFIARCLCLFLVICEMLLTSTAENMDFPPKFNVNYPRPDRKQNGRKSRSQGKGHQTSKSNFDDESIEQSKILHFIDTIRTNATARALKCNSSKDNTISLSKFDYKFDSKSFQRFTEQADKGRLLAKAMTDLFIRNRTLEIRSHSDESVYAIISVLKTLLEKDEVLAGGGIAFSTNFFPYIVKHNDGSLSEAKDLSKSLDFTHADFYSIPKKKHDTSAAVNVISGSDGKYTVPANFESSIFWGQPSFDCSILKRWIVAASFPFFGLNQTGTALTFKGAVLFDLDLNRTSVNQCKDSTTIFSGSHKCRPETTQCRYLPGNGLAPGNYNCHCKPGFYFPALNATQKYFSGTQLERHFRLSGSNFSAAQDFQCLPCRQGCQDCADDSPCLAEYNLLMRGIPLGIQSFCMTITLVLGIVILRFRKCKVMVIGMWCLLEIIILGALFLYATVVIQYFEPSTTTCLITPWLREVGFAILYGALVLKIYRILADFQSRKAHRVHVRDKDLLKYLLCIVIVVTGYMAAWTAVSIDQVQEGQSMVDDRGVTSEGELRYLVCKSGWWDYSTEVAEVMFLLFGIYLCYKVRAAPSEYSEGTYVSAAICYECFISTVFYVLRHIYWLNLHPDFLFLMYFLRCQLTVSVTLVLVFGPKLWYAHRPPDERQIRNRAYSSSDVPDNMAPETMKLNVGISSNGDVDVGEVSLADMDPEDIRLNVGISSNGDVDVGEVNLADMDPEDIRAELKRLYTQLQIYKTRSMRKDNPHISKRRGGRKTTHRRFSLQAFHHKHRHHHDHDHEHEMSKTPEESTNSAEGLPMPLEMSVSKCEDLNETKPATTVSFKMCHTHK